MIGETNVVIMMSIMIAIVVTIILCVIMFCIILVIGAKFGLVRLQQNIDGSNKKDQANSDAN